MTWVSPLNYGAALATGNGLNLYLPTTATSSMTLLLENGSWKSATKTTATISTTNPTTLAKKANTSASLTMKALSTAYAATRAISNSIRPCPPKPRENLCQQ